MAHRNGTYIAFHAEGKTDPTASDIKYYRTLKMWHENDDIDFRFVNSHEKQKAVSDSASKQAIKASLMKRLDHSKNMILILGKTTRLDTDFVPFEIRYAVDTCKIPIIVAYTQYSSILNPESHRDEWPAALAERIDNQTARAIHIPFKRNALDDAISRFTAQNPPGGSLVHYTREGHQQLGIAVPHRRAI